MLRKYWVSEKQAYQGKIVDASKASGFVAEQGEKRVGLITYRFEDNECEIVTLNSVVEGIGVGSSLLDAVTDAAQSAHCRRLRIFTTNDNTEALHFYQKRGFTLVAIHRNAVEKARKLKPEIPLTGKHGIPLRDEIELGMLLQQ
jgi:ribosomal protein S18 acetylase RimI-like enzyme